MEIDRAVDGAFCWAEGAVADLAKAKAFYSAVLGWSFEDVPLPDGSVYPIAKVGGRSVGALFQIRESMPMPPAWSSYVQVSDADATAARVTELGGKLLMPVMDVMEEGRMVAFTDPTGAAVNAWQPKQHAGFGRLGDHGAPCWFELATTNLDVAQGFYEKLFHWTMSLSKNSPMQYIELTPAGAPFAAGGMMQMGKEFGSIPSHWMIYFAVDDVAKALSAAREHGGTVVHEPHDIPQVGTFSVLKDPGGAVFSVIKLLPVGG